MQELSVVLKKQAGNKWFIEWVEKRPLPCVFHGTEPVMNGGEGVLVTCSTLLNTVAG